MRLVVEAEDYDEAVRFYRDVLGLPEELAVGGPDGAHVTILSAGRATLEIANPAQKRYIDAVEVGRDVAPKYRLAFEVDDSAEVTNRVIEGRATLIAPPTETPWRSLNSRLEAPGGIQLTLFQELDSSKQTQTQTFAELRIWGASAAMLALTGIGDVTHAGNRTARRQLAETSWRCRSSRPLTSDLAEHVASILAQLDTFWEQIVNVARSGYCQLSIALYVGEGPQPPWYLTPAQIARLAELGSEVDVDIYPWLPLRS